MKIISKPINWEPQSGDYEGEHGFYIAQEGKIFAASWGEGDCEDFDTLEDAKNWCQTQINDYFSEFGMIQPELFDAPNVQIEGLAAQDLAGAPKVD